MMINIMFLTFIYESYFKPIITTISNPKVIIKLIFQNECAFFNSINSKATNRNLKAAKIIIKGAKTAETDNELAIKAVVMVRISSKAQVKFSDFFIVKRINKGWEIKATKSSRTCAKKQRMLRHLQQQYQNLSFSFRNSSNLE
jgi:hypothetical protein